METTQDLIVDISESREKFFGCSGKMLIPCPATVEALLKEVPAHQLITTELLRAELARRHEVQVTCPSATKQALQALANDPGKNVTYWRVIKKNGEMIASFPGGSHGHAALLRNEGFTTDVSGAKPKVINFKESLVQFG